MDVIKSLLYFVEDIESTFRLCDLAVMIDPDESSEIVNTHIRPVVTKGFNLDIDRFIEYDTPWLYRYMSRNDLGFDITSKTLGKYRHRMIQQSNNDIRFTLEDTAIFERCIGKSRFLDTTVLLLVQNKLKHAVPFWIDILIWNDDTLAEELVLYMYNNAKKSSLFCFDALLYTLVSPLSNSAIELYLEKLLDFFYDEDHLFSSAENQYLCCAIWYQNQRGHTFTGDIRRAFNYLGIRGHPCESWVLLQYLDKAFSRHIPWRFLEWASGDDPDAVASIYATPHGVHVHGRNPEEVTVTYRDYPLDHILAFDTSNGDLVNEENFAHLMQTFTF